MSNLRRMTIEVQKKLTCLETGAEDWVPDFNETSVSTGQGLRNRLETIAKTLGPRTPEETKKLDPARQILRKIRKKVNKFEAKSDIDNDCFQQSYNRAHIEFLSLYGVTLDHETEFALKRLYQAAAHIVRTIELLERDE